MNRKPNFRLILKIINLKIKKKSSRLSNQKDVLFDYSNVSVNLDGLERKGRNLSEKISDSSFENLSNFTPSKLPQPVSTLASFDRATTANFVNRTETNNEYNFSNSKPALCHRNESSKSAINTEKVIYFLIRIDFYPRAKSSWGISFKSPSTLSHLDNSST